MVHINLYQSYSDRGAFVQKGAWQHDEVQDSAIRIGEELPNWPGCHKPIVKSYTPNNRLELDYQGKTVIIKAGEEKQLDSSLFSQEYGVCCYILLCVKLPEPAWDTIVVSSDVTACDPGCNHISFYKGSIALADVTPDKELTRIVDNEWWQSSINPKYDKLYLLEATPDNARFKYGDREILVEAGKVKAIDKIPLDYAYSELYIELK